MKFCTNCGASLEDNSLFCSGCGSRIDAPAPVAEPEPAPAFEPVPTPTFDPAPAPAKKKSKTPMILGIIAGVLVVAIVACIILSSFLTATLKTVLEVNSGDFEKAEKLAPKEYWEYLEEEYEGFTLDKAIDWTEETYKDDFEATEELMGDKLRSSFIITHYTPMPKGMVEAAAEYLDDEFGIDADSVKRGCEITFDFTAKGDAIAEMSRDETVQMLNIDGKWYTVHIYSTMKDDKRITACEFNIPYYIEMYIHSEILNQY